MSVQLYQLVIDGALEKLRTLDRSNVKSAFEIINNLFGGPFQVSLSGTVLSISSSEYQTLMSDDESTTKNREKVGMAPILDTYRVIAVSTLDVSDGSVTGDFATLSSPPSITADYYVSVILELLSADNKWHVKFGTGTLTSGDALLSTNIAKFTPNAVEKRAVIVLQKNGTTGTWGLLAPTYENLRVLPLSVGRPAHPYTQFTAETSKTVTHNMGKIPRFIFISDADNKEIVPQEIEFSATPSGAQSLNVAIVTFSSAVTGKLYYE
jgi:hypothetical protein